MERKKADLQSILDQVNKLGQVIIAIDQAEKFKGKMGKKMLSLLAHSYDYCKNITFILTATQVGLLLDLLDTYNISSPLYGYTIDYVRVEPFSKTMSIEFLTKGFSEYGLNVDEDLLVYAVDRLGGIVGWLAELGYKAVENGKLTKELIDEVVSRTIQLSIKELLHFSPNSRYILEAIASGYKSYNEIKNFLENKTGSVVHKPALSHYMQWLEAMGYITRDEEGKYELFSTLLSKYL